VDEAPEHGYLGHVKKAKISELRDQLSRYLDHVRAGGRVLVLDRDRPVAEIVPVGARPARGVDADEDRLASLERQGLLRRGTGRIPNDLLREPPPGEGAGVLAALLEERAEGR
jgi:antitoxin (DNA-binding transcriptional repressor) of toxin-antitoxin stability system